MLQIKNLRINSKENNTTLIEDASIFVNGGEIVLLEGVNGSGKSTILNAIMHNPSYEIEEGDIVMDGVDVTNLETHELAKKGIYLSMQHHPEIEGVSTIKMLYKSHKFLSPESSKSITDFKKDIEAKCNYSH